MEFEVDTKARKVIKSSCRCVAGESAECKHGAALYLHINEERSEDKTDRAQVWSAPSKALIQKYPKGRTTQKILLLFFIPFLVVRTPNGYAVYMEIW